MKSIFGKVKAVVTLVLAFGVSGLPACGTMGGGMGHLIDVPFSSSQATTST